MADAPKQYRKTVQHQGMFFFVLGNTQGRYSHFLFLWAIFIISANEPSTIPETLERWTDDEYKLYFRKFSYTQ